MSTKEDLPDKYITSEEEAYANMDDLDLTPKQITGLRHFFQGIAEGKDFNEIAEDIGVTRETLWRWRQNQDWMEGMKRLYDQGLIECLPLVIKTFKKKLQDALEEGGMPGRNDVSIAKMVMNASGVMDRDRGDDTEFIKIERNTETEKEVEKADE